MDLRCKYHLNRRKTGTNRNKGTKITEGTSTVRVYLQDPDVTLKMDRREPTTSTNKESFSKRASSPSDIR